MSTPDAQAPTSVGALPPAVTQLLAAIRDALDVPLADRPVDDTVRAELLTRRASDTRVIVELLLQHGDVEHHTARLREWTGEHPVTYPTWQARTEQAAAEEEELLDDGEAVRRSVDRAFPTVAAFLADERGEQQ
ncbi:hypothetical protein ACFUTV_39085 [Streptomyces sp. NPDC057298]|uniref:hypothetical protein n=1 Tax=Streptomyces sp. NPDC057298 TaxID=3346091 RepID=UPI0036295C5C